jgi:hypothetical protein
MGISVALRTLFPPERERCRFLYTSCPDTLPLASSAPVVR